ncbi:XRE family transcriptional regulator [Komagataeibacter medellinensis]|uniref:XRE family transcriptional regulator n=2 Tax=Komagataeibacter medellinensis TaxID=1177712 RepID=A0ABQ6VY40_9PROT|nr:XRE family transcriptional regulator [Komagataeibacter medellinensis]
MATSQEIGAFLTKLRNDAGLKQAALAKRLEWSGPLLSRIEGGGRAISDEELDIILRGIGTSQALSALTTLRRNWSLLDAPSLTDPDSDLLWRAEEVAREVHELAERPDVRQFFERRLVRYKEELIAAAHKVRDKSYRVALLGTIGVGKSTAICRAEGLEMPSDRGMPKAVLETGSGGITICEVHVRRGPSYGVIVEPCSEEEIRRQVSEFATFLLNPSQPDEDGGGVDGGSPGISREVERAIRNMAEFKRRRAERKPDGAVSPAWDEARELAGQHKEVKDLSVEILARMALHRRDRRDIWYSDTSGQPALEWLQGMFEQINNGRHPEFGLPKRIELVIPLPILGENDIEVTLVDTQGIDDIAERADLEQHFDDSHTIAILCTVFNEAPATAVRQLLIRAKEGGVRTLKSHAAILVLPRPGDALAMKDNGVPVHSAEEGYDVKAEEVSLKLHPLGLDGLPIQFFNAAEEVPGILRHFLLQRIRAVQDEHRRELSEIIEGAEALLINYEKEQSREVMRVVARQLTTWLSNNATLTPPINRRVRDSLARAIRSAHVQTIYASVIREGEWANLDYSHQLSHGARRVAAAMAEPRLRAFQEVAVNILNDPEFADAHDLVRQTVRALSSCFDALIRKTQLVGQSVYADEMRADAEFWRACYREWGRGRGYRERVAKRNEEWFDDTEHDDSDIRVIETIAAEWSAGVASVEALLEQN